MNLRILTPLFYLLWIGLVAFSHLALRYFYWDLPDLVAIQFDALGRPYDWVLKRVFLLRFGVYQPSLNFVFGLLAIWALRHPLSRWVYFPFQRYWKTQSLEVLKLRLSAVIALLAVTLNFWVLLVLSTILILNGIQLPFVSIGSTVFLWGLSGLVSGAWIYWILRPPQKDSGPS